MQGKFNLKPVDTVIHTRPVVGLTASKLLSPALRTAIERFDANKQLKEVETRVSRSPVVGVTQALLTTICRAVRDFDQRKLKRVQRTRVSTTPVVIVAGKAAPVSERRQLLDKIASFDHHCLKEVTTRVYTKPVVVVEAPAIPAVAPAPSNAPAPPVASNGVMAFQANLNKLVELGFTDRKASIAALVTARNNLESAVISLLEKK